MSVDRNQPADRDDARRLCDAAARGPWSVDGPYWHDDTDCAALITDAERIAVAIQPRAFERHPRYAANLKFIAAARSLVPALLDELDEAYEEIRHYVQAEADAEEIFGRLRAQVQAAERTALTKAADALDVEKNGISPESYYMTDWAIRWLRERAAALVPTDPVDGLGADRG